MSGFLSLTIVKVVSACKRTSVDFRGKIIEIAQNMENIFFISTQILLPASRQVLKLIWVSNLYFSKSQCRCGSSKISAPTVGRKS